MEEIWQKIVHWSSDIKYIALHNLLFQAYSWNKPGEKRRGLCKGLIVRESLERAGFYSHSMTSNAENSATQDIISEYREPGGFLGLKIYRFLDCI